MSTLIISQLIKLGFAITILLYLCSKTVESKCKSDCNLGLASYYVQRGETLELISGYFNNVNVTDIVSYNRDRIPNKDSLEAGTRINIPFPCGCVNDTFLGHVFSYAFRKGDTYESVAQFNYTNLTTFGWIQEVNSFLPDNVPVGAIINVPVNCSCGNSSVSMDYGLFITYPLRAQDSLSSISKQFGLNESLLQEYNPGANFSAGDGIVYIPGKDESGNYLPLVLRKSSGSGLAGGVIIGICIAAVIIIIILSVWVYLRCIKRKKVNKASLLPEKSENQLSGSIGEAGGSTNIPGVNIDKSVEFSYEELAKSTDNFNFSFKIGQGGYGTVYFAELRGEKAAIKKMDIQASKEFFAELKVLTHVHHLNLVRLLGYCVEDSLFLVYEYVENGNLSQHLRSSGRDPLQWSTRVQIALDTARGLEYIHEHTVPLYIHRDIKPANILINNNFQAKVADFGLAKLSDVGNGTLPTRLVGTFGYMPPEYAQFGEVTPKVDVFAFGVVLYELISAKEAVVKQSNSAVELTSLADLFEDALSKPDPNEITKLIDPRLGDDYPLESVRQVAELAKACTHDNPHLRPSMKSVVVALTTLSSATGNWDIDSFYGNDALLNRVSGR
ncbi:lysM domain receptor-like kinase 3 isoform X2 [Silene latifolia]|uniref:lysM domain receptor-like kinase 3 isoform X2 n=1 Tax=Silene latifolia TaxID=37657 RepID=UPI003D782C5C